MAIGTPYTLGGSAAAAGSASSTFTSSSATTTGDAVIVALGSSDVTITPTGTTVASPTLTLAQVNSQVANTQSSWLYVLENATALTTSSVVTTAWSGTTQVKNMQGIACSGLATSSATDTAAIGKGNGSGVTATATTGTLAVTNSLLVAVCTSGFATTSHTWGAGWTQIGSTRRPTGGSYMSAAIQVVSTTTPVTASCTLGATGLWAMTVTPLKGATAGGLAITTTTLASGTVGTPYADTLIASGGAPPYLFDTTAGSIPTGLTLNQGQPGGGTDVITHVAANGGPDGTPGQSITDWTSAYAAIGPLTGIKTFFSGDLPATFIGTLADQARTAHPACVPIICWNGTGTNSTTPSTAAVITRFCATIPPGVSVGFGWQQEPENPTSNISGAAFVSGFTQIAAVIHGLGRPELFTITSSTWGQYGVTGNGVNGAYLPPGSAVDVYGFDLYQHQAGGSLNGVTSWPANGISTAGCHFQRWLALVKPLAAPLGRQLALTEYGIDVNTGTAAARNKRLQDDYAYIKTAFNGGTASPYPLFMLLYWYHNMASANNDYKFTDAATIATYKGIAAGSSSGGGGSTGGQITGTPTTAAGSPFSFTARVTDALSATATHAESITISTSAALGIDTTTVPQGTLGGVYTAQLLAHGGTLPYSWSVFSGTPPTGVGLAADGSFSGTPSVAGTYNFTVRVTDNVSATANQALTIVVAGGLMITTTSLPTGQVGVVYTATLAAAGGTVPMSWGLATGSGPLPAGLILDPDAATISGTPTVAGAFPINLQVTDAGGAGVSDTQPVTLTVAAAGGGLPAIGRRRFGGGSADWVGRFVGDNWDRAPNATVLFFTALAGGGQYTDLQTTGGSPIDSVTADANGAWGEIYGPANVLRMAIDANGGNGPRAWVYANDLTDLVAVIYAGLKPLTG